MKYLSVCDGIGAAHVAWKPLGWSCIGASEIERFPIAVVNERHPEIPELGDMNNYHDWNIEQPDLVCGGTPCQSFSVAGLRKGLADPRGNLALVFLAIVDHFRPRWVVWENVPGVLSSGGGRDFGAFIGGLGQLGYGFAYRVLDAQFFGVAQRRRRVFVVGHLGDWRRAAAVLFERHSLQGHPAPRREAGERAAGYAESSIGGYREDSAAGTLKRSGGVLGGGSETFIAHALRGEGFDASEDGTGRGTPLVPVAVMENVRGELRLSEQSDALTRGGGKPGQGYAAALVPAVAFTCSEQANSYAWERPFAPTLNAQVPNDSSNIQQGVRIGSAVRRLTPRECERLQGFEDDYTLIPWRKGMAPDGPRYKALGNSWAVPVVRWIGERIELFNAVTEQLSRA